MGLTTSSVAELNARTSEALRRTLQLLRAVDPDLHLIDSEWTARDVSVHLLNILHRYIKRDFSKPDGLADDVTDFTSYNVSELDASAGVTHSEAIDQLEREAPQFFELDLPLDARYPFHGKTSVDGLGARSNWLGELLLHGWDVARAANRPWPLDDRDMVLMLHANLQVAGGWIDPAKVGDRRIKVALKIVDATPQVFDIAGGKCTVRDLVPGERLDSAIRARGTPAALMFWGRMNLLGAVRNGVMVVGGRRPWVGLALPKMFLPT